MITLRRPNGSAPKTWRLCVFTAGARCFALGLIVLLRAFLASAGEVHSIRHPLTFEPNRGQANKEVRFLARAPQGTIFLTDREIVLSPGGRNSGAALRMHFVRSGSLTPVAERPTGGKTNYYLSKDPEKWLSQIPFFRQIRYQQAFPGTDVVFHGNGDELEYDFEVSPHSPVDRIAFAFEGTERVLPKEDGGLDVVVGATTWHLVAPKAYQQIGQEKRTVKASYAANADGEISLKVEKFDESFPLIIDPIVEYTDFVSVNNQINIAGLQADASGNLWIGGDTFAQDYPVQNGKGPKSTGTQQVFITEVNAAGDTILFSTFLPASGFSNAQGIGLDPQGNAYLLGVTGSADFPLTSTNLGVCGQFCNAGFVAKFSLSGSLIYSTLLGVGQILPYNIAVDAQGEVLVSGGAFDNSLKTVNAFQSAYEGGLCTSCGSPFFAKLNASGTDFVFSSYFGGAGNTTAPSLAKGIAVDGSGNVILAGIATADPPLAQPWEYGDGGLFLTEFAPDGKTLLFSTRLGGSVDTNFGSLIGVTVGPDGTVYLIGNTAVPDFPFSLNAYALPQEPFGQYSSVGMYVLAVSPSFSGLKYSTYLGNRNVNAFAVDALNHLHVAGFQLSVPPSPLVPLKAVVSDITTGGFALELDPSGAPVTMTQFGGHFSPEIPTALAVDSNQNVYLAGQVSLQNLSGPIQSDPVFLGAQPRIGSGYNYNVFLAKISPQNAPQISLSAKPPALILRDAGSADLHLNSIDLGGGLAKQWGNCGQTVPAGTSCVLTVSDGSGNLAAGTVTINSDASPASQTFTIDLPPGTKAGSAIGDIVWFPDVVLSYPPQMQGTTSSSTALEIWNVGTSSALINSISTTGFASETNDCSTLAPGANCTIQVSITPTGSGDGSIQILYDNNPTGQQFNVIYSLITTQPLMLSTNQLGFGTQQINGVAIPRVVNVTNTSNTSIAAPSASLQGDPAFTISGNTCTAPLLPHQSCAIAVQLGSNTAGTFSGTLSIGGQSAGSQVSLYGGTQNNTLVQTSPVGLDFGAVAVGSSQTLSLTLTNSAFSPYQISQRSFSLPDYSETDNCHGQIPVGEQCTLSVKFVPSQLGLRRSALSIGVSISSLVQVTTVSGLGVIPLEVSPSSLNLGSNILVGTASPAQPVILQNQTQSAQLYTIATTPGFLFTNPCANPLPPASSCSVNVQFEEASVGPEQGTLTVSYSNTSMKSQVALTGTATATAFMLQAASGQSLSATVQSGGTAIFRLQAVAATGFGGAVQLSCSGAPQSGSCSVPSSVTLTSGGTSNFAVNVSTSQTTAALHVASGYPLFADIVIFSFVGLSGARIRACLALVGFACLLGVVGCSSGGASQQTNKAPQSFTLTVTGTSGTFSQPITLTLNIN